MANYIFSVDGAETGTVGGRETAFVYNLDFFDKTDTVSASIYGSKLDFEIEGAIDLNLNGYSGITGFDTVIARSATGGVHLTLGQNIFPFGYGPVSVIAQSDVNGKVVLDASAIGRAQDVNLDARSDGDNVLIGGDFNDTLSGGAGADHFDGGDGIDRVNFSDSSAGVKVDLLRHIGFGGDAQGDAYFSIERVWGSNSGDTLIGGHPDGFLIGDDGDDILVASGGLVRGDAGDDILIVSSAVTSCFGGSGIDQVRFETDPDGAAIDLLDTEDRFAEIENVYGSESNDYISGDAGANVLEGAGDDDELYGRGGSDVLRGGAGADRLNGGDGSDTVSYWYGSVGVTVNLATRTVHGGDAEGDILTGFEILSGSQGNDQLTGDKFANTLQGWNGNDVLKGNLGKDVLAGGAGADRFVFSTIDDSLTGANADRISDFSHVQGDRIDLSEIDANTGVRGFEAFTFIGSSLYTGAGQLRAVNTSPGITTIAGDVNGDGVSDFHIQLAGNLVLVAGDFIL
ncbi:Ca2+-binding RTX toxin-like protein [Inquilinus ginsengisoli]|uniref:calcium-binding protein n=1 Tax=Inquilinus ginsengisoli TaxID=363840 RepID=UPI003D1F4346